MILFTADPHFGRASVVDKANRPFRNVAEMNARIMAGYLSRVGPDDDLYVVGDFAHKSVCEGAASFWFGTIPGRKHLIRGNHDDSVVTSLPWDSVSDILEVDAGGVTFVLSHYPMASWNNVRLGNMHLFGHLHDKFPGSRRAINVGVDHWEWAPCDAGQILARARTLGEHPGWDVMEPAMIDRVVAA